MEIPLPILRYQSHKSWDNSELYNQALSCWPLGLTIEKDLVGPKARLTLVECFPVERRGCGLRGGASPAYSAVPMSRELSAPFERRGAELPRTEGWSFPSLFCL